MSRISKRTSETIEPESSEGVTVQVWARRPVCGARASVIDRLGRLQSEGIIEEFEVQTWPEEVVLDDGDEPIPRLVKHLEEWASEQGVSLRPPFERRTVSPLIGESREVLTLPMLTLVVYADGLAGVYPCSDGDRTVTVEAFLDQCQTKGEAVVDPDL